MRKKLLNVPLYDGISDDRIGKIVIDPARDHYVALAKVGERKRKSYYELMAYNPSGVPTTITWGMLKADMDGDLRFDDTFDSQTLAWIKSYGHTGATYSVRPFKPS